MTPYRIRPAIVKSATMAEPVAYCNELVIEYTTAAAPADTSII